VLCFFSISINRGQTGKGATKAADHTAIAMTTTKLKNKDVIHPLQKQLGKKKTTDDDKDLIASRLSTPPPLKGKDNDDTSIQSNLSIESNYSDNNEWKKKTALSFSTT